MLSAPEVRQLARTVHLEGGKAKTAEKSELCALLLEHSRRQRGLFTDNLEASLLRLAKQMLGRCCRIRPCVRHVFDRLDVLFFHKRAWGDHSSFTLLQTDREAVVYPQYMLTASTLCFRLREQLSSYTLALKDESELDKHMLSSVQHVAQRHVALMEDLKKDDVIIDCSSLMDCGCKSEAHVAAGEGEHLARLFTASNILVRMLSRTVEALERLHEYDSAGM